jgi:hypothetical protein
MAGPGPLPHLGQKDGRHPSLAAPDCFAGASRGGIQCGSSHLATHALGWTRRWWRELLGPLFKSQTVIELISTRCLRKRRCGKASHQNDHERTNSHFFLQRILRHRRCILGSPHTAPVLLAGALTDGGRLPRPPTRKRIWSSEPGVRQKEKAAPNGWLQWGCGGATIGAAVRS